MTFAYIAHLPQPSLAMYTGEKGRLTLDSEDRPPNEDLATMCLHRSLSFRLAVWVQASLSRSL